MGWAVAAPAIASLVTGIYGATKKSQSDANAANIQGQASAEAIALQKQMYEQQRQDELAARARRLALAGNNRQVLMGDNGKMTLGAPNKTLADYSVSGLTSPTVTGNTSLGSGLGGGSGDGGNKQLGADSLDAGMSNPQPATNAPGMVKIKNYQTGESRSVPADQFAQWEAGGWVMDVGGN